MGLKEIQVPFHSHRNLRGIWVHVSDFKREIWGSSLIFRKGKRRESWKLQMCKCITWRLFHFNTHLHCTDRQIICEFFRRIWSSLEHEWLCHHPPTFACWNPIPPCSSVWRWGLRVVIRSWKYSHHGGINALIKGSSRELSFCLSPYTHTHTHTVWGHNEKVTSKEEEVSSHQTQPCWHKDLGHPSLQTVLKPPGLQ